MFLGNSWAILSPSKVQKELFRSLLGNPGSAKKAWKLVKLHNIDGINPYGVFVGVLDDPRLMQGLLKIFLPVNDQILDPLGAHVWQDIRGS